MDAALELYVKPPPVDGLWDQPAGNAPDELLDKLRSVFRNGGVQFATFSLATNPRLDWFVACNREHEINFMANLLASPAVRTALPELGAPRTCPAGQWVALNPEALANEFATVLEGGGPYLKYRSGDAKEVGQRACQVLFGDHPDDYLVFRTTYGWSSWFCEVAWDNTWVGIDKNTRRVWLLCTTDTD
jgi:hypothetical protein